MFWGQKMKIEIPDINEILPKMIEVESTFNNRTMKISDWVNEHKTRIKENKKLIVNESEKNDIKVLGKLIRDLLVRYMSGERGIKIYNEFKKIIKSKNDLNVENYEKILKNAKYRWTIEDGVKIMSEVVSIFKDKYEWDWEKYFNLAEKYKEDDFQQDEMLRIKNIGFKLRDLALSSFSKNYVAFDSHVVTVITRIGLLNYGFDLLKDRDLEMGNNPAKQKNYLFLHKLILKLSKLSNYSPTELDRIFWLFGKSVCKTDPKCEACPIKYCCLTGRERGINK